MIQTLVSTLAHLVALLLYPGLVAMLAFGGVTETVWIRLGLRDTTLAELPWRRPGPAVVIAALCAALASVEVAAPLSPVPADETSVVVAAGALIFVAWAELALNIGHSAKPALVLLIQCCWLLAVLGPAVQPESLRPQVLGNVLVPALLPVKIASALLYLLCLPALLRLWPLAPPGERRTRHRIDAVRVLCWFPYCGLFTTLFITPSSEDIFGALRFIALTFGVAASVIAAGVVMQRRGAVVVRAMYTRLVMPYAVLVLLAVVVTSVLMR